jgi:hypothetical protein
MSLKTENSRRVAKSRPVCMGLKSLLFFAIFPPLFQKIVYKYMLYAVTTRPVYHVTSSYQDLFSTRGKSLGTRLICSVASSSPGPSSGGSGLGTRMVQLLTQSRSPSMPVRGLRAPLTCERACSGNEIVVDVSNIELVTAPKCQKQLLLSTFLREVVSRRYYRKYYAPIVIL